MDKVRIILLTVLAGVLMFFTLLVITLKGATWLLILSPLALIYLNLDMLGGSK